MNDDTLKLTVLRHFTTQHNIDIFRFTKHNKCWDLVLKTLQLAEQTKGWWENAQWSVSYNKHKLHPTEHRPGGTGILIINELSHWALQPGSNTSGIGRCPLSTYQQQVHYLAQMNGTDSPKQLFLTNLTTTMMEWQAEGYLIILFADLNKDIRDQKVKQMLSSAGLVDIAMTLHQQQPPATHNWGSTPIDGIFILVTLTEYCQVGYLAFGEAILSNHCAVWLDILAFLCVPT